MRHYLLTDNKRITRRGIELRVGRYNQSRSGLGDIISSNSWECAPSAVLAVMINPLAEENARPRLFELREKIYVGTDSEDMINLQVREIFVPAVSLTQRIAFAALAVRALNSQHAFSDWVERWVYNVDRSVIGIRVARESLRPVSDEMLSLKAALEAVGASFGDDSKSLCDDEFARRAREVLQAAMSYTGRIHGWQLAVAEHVATAVAGLHDLSDLDRHANEAVALVAPEKEGMPWPANFVSAPRQIIRRDDDDGQAPTTEPGIYTFAPSQASGDEVTVPMSSTCEGEMPA